jgi:hypothetical protein
MEDLEFLKAMLDEINVNIKSKQEKAETDRKANRETLKEIMKSNHERAEANRKADKEDLLAKLETDREERKADQEDLKRTMEGMMTANQAKTDVKLKQLTERIEKNSGRITDSKDVPRRAGKEAPGRPSKNRVRVPQRL